MQCGRKTGLDCKLYKTIKKENKWKACGLANWLCNTGRDLHT